MYKFTPALLTNHTAPNLEIDLDLDLELLTFQQTPDPATRLSMYSSYRCLVPVFERERETERERIQGHQ
jgi:hypothetical protein